MFVFLVYTPYFSCIKTIDTLDFTGFDLNLVSFVACFDVDLDYTNLLVENSQIRSQLTIDSVIFQIAADNFVDLY